MSTEEDRVWAERMTDKLVIQGYVLRNAPAHIEMLEEGILELETELEKERRIRLEIQRGQEYR